MKKVILTTNEHAIKEVQRNAETATKLLNDFIKKAEAEAKVKFSDDEKIQLKENGTEFLTNYFKAKYPFPQLSDAYNLKALEVDINGLLTHNKKGQWNAYNFKLNKNGAFEIDGKLEQLEACYTYVETDKQAEALKLAEDISELLNKAMEKGLLEKRMVTAVKNLGDLLWTESIPGTFDSKVVPNKNRIARMMNETPVMKY